MLKAKFFAFLQFWQHLKSKFLIPSQTVVSNIIKATFYDVYLYCRIRIYDAEKMKYHVCDFSKNVTLPLYDYWFLFSIIYDEKRPSCCQFLQIIFYWKVYLQNYYPSRLRKIYVWRFFSFSSLTAYTSHILIFSTWN